ncbi:hypothetical protein GCM10007387_44500 [Pseudoduganella albidiflava]|uniref:Uncharacterized protein n=1 Tax=Pseudoduganella albidiflava TaxID=321983 RepID=A0AA88C4K5_9BURK|nr:hypothetical protein GCM10007387_44500 [Pseudoduganella albidiflava]
MVQPARAQRMRQRTHDVLLADERFKVAGTVLASEDLIGHAGILPQTRAGEANNSPRAMAGGTVL